MTDSRTDDAPKLEVTYEHTITMDIDLAKLTSECSEEWATDVADARADGYEGRALAHEAIRRFLNACLESPDPTYLPGVKVRNEDWDWDWFSRDVDAACPPLPGDPEEEPPVQRIPENQLTLDGVLDHNN